MIESKTKRIGEWDFYKGFLVIMVVWGHTANGLGAYEKIGILKYISAFRVSYIMPLFLIIAGYFIYRKKSESKTIQYIIKKIRRLVIPAVIWGGCSGILNIAISLITEKNISVIEIIYKFLSNIKYLWFLYATFCSAIIIWIIEKLFLREKIKNIVLLLTSTILFFIPTDIWWLSFSFSFILVGYFCSKYEKIFSIINENIIGITSIFLYFFLLLFFSYDQSIYISGSNLITNNPIKDQIHIDYFRFILGLLGSISFIWIAKRIYKISKHHRLIKSIEYIGGISLEMYTTQFIIVERIFLLVMRILAQHNIIFTSNPYLCFFIWRPLFGTILVGVTYKVVVMIKKWGIGKYVY